MYLQDNELISIYMLIFNLGLLTRKITRDQLWVKLEVFKLIFSLPLNTM